MITVGVRELRAQLSKLLQRVHQHGEVVEITYHGEVVARLAPANPAPVDAAGMAALWADLDQLAAEIGARWPDGVAAADAVRADRREL